MFMTYSDRKERGWLPVGATSEYFRWALGERFGWSLAYVFEQSEFAGVHPNK